MTDKVYMKLAIEEAKNSLAAGGAPIGAIMVKDGEVIANGWSMVWPEKDPTSHAETNCIKAAYKKLHPLNLDGCTLYSTLESCSMCLGCGSWAGLSRVIFGAYSKDIPPNPYELSDYTAESHGKRLTPFNIEHKTEVVGGVLREECAKLMVSIEYWTPKK
jgi:tRNA(adenine34) deaminase